MVLGVCSKRGVRKTSSKTQSRLNAALSSLTARAGPARAGPSASGSSGSSSSRQIHRLYVGRSQTGNSTSQEEVLNPKQILERQAKQQDVYQERIDTMLPAERQELEALRAGDFNNCYSRSQSPEHQLNIRDVLTGDSTMDISHVGGEFAELLAIGDDLFGLQRTCTRDYRTRRDRTERRNQAFLKQMPAIVDSYMAWSLAVGEGGIGGDYSPPDGIESQGQSNIMEMDMFRSRPVTLFHLPTDKFVSTAIIRHGLIPCAPYMPTSAFTIRVLEFYRIAHNRCPHLSIHAFVKTLCDLYCVPFKLHLSRQFSISFDVYLSIRTHVDERVQIALGRNTPDWRLRNACSPCTYELTGEPKLKYRMLYTADGNESLRRIYRHEPEVKNPDEDAEMEDTAPKPAKSSESTDTRQVGKGTYLTRAQVDCWAAEMLASFCPERNEDHDGNPCAGRWKNMKADLTAKMWGMFEETGLFLALCRHGFVLILADMVRSGELSKYPFAIVAKMLDVFGEDLALGYDIGCRFETTLKNSPLSEDVQRKNHRCLVGAFHGHAHNRLCQSQFLATYVEGLGIEDLEGCERFFAKSNALAASTRHASVFHRRQAIYEYATYHGKFETYQNLSTFLLNNYKQALKLLETEPAVSVALAKLGATDGGVVQGWLKEEHTYLKGLSKEPLEETLEMEYYKMVLSLRDSERKLVAANALWLNLTPATVGQRDFTASTETVRRHALELQARDFTAVQAMERRLDILVRWQPESIEWKAAAEKVTLRRYQRCIDVLEGLIVARMFELTKMNMSQTGYSLRKHISKALKARSQAIRTALTKYNSAAAELQPPRAELSWDEVVEYAFLADFDLLRDTRQDIRERPWATPAARLTMDSYFKILRAREEIVRLNVEIPRFATYMRDEDIYLHAKEASIQPTNPTLAYAIRIHRMESGRFNEHHRLTINKIVRLKGFSGGPLLGTHLPHPTPTPPNLHLTTRQQVERAYAATSTPCSPPPTTLQQSEVPDNDMSFGGEEDAEAVMEEEQAGEDEEEAIIGAFCSVFEVSCDVGDTVR